MSSFSEGIFGRTSFTSHGQLGKTASDGHGWHGLDKARPLKAGDETRSSISSYPALPNGRSRPDLSSPTRVTDVYFNVYTSHTNVYYTSCNVPPWIEQHIYTRIRTQTRTHIRFFPLPSFSSSSTQPPKINRRDTCACIYVYKILPHLSLDRVIDACRTCGTRARITCTASFLHILL